MCPPPVPGVAVGYGMRAGTFSRPTTTGNQIVTHNLGTTPKALIIYTSGMGPYFGRPSGPGATFNERASTANFATGFTDGTTTRSTGAIINTVGGPTPTAFTDCARRYSTSIIVRMSSNGDVRDEAAFVSWTSTTFTINWTTISGIPDSARLGLCYAIYGAAAINAKVLEWTFDTSGGNQAVTGAGFLPQLALHTHAFRGSAGASADAIWGFGAMDSARQWSHAIFGLDNNANMQNTACARRSNRAIQAIDQNGTLTMAGSLVSLDADGFTISRDTPPSSGILIASLCMNGFTNVRVDTPTRSPTTGTAPFNQTFTGIGFKPTGLLTAGAITGGDINQMIGAADGASQAVAANWVPDGGNDAANETRTDSVVLDIRGSGPSAGPTEPATTDVKANQYQFNDDGYVLNVTTGSTAAHDATIFQSDGDAQAVGVIRNYGDLIVGGATPVEKIVMLTSKSAFLYTPQTTSTGIWTATPEVYTGTDIQRFSIANSTDATYGAVAVWSQGKDELRYYDGTTFGTLITSGTNHAARTVLAFNNRIISVRPLVAGVDQKTQIRWCVNGDFADWAGLGSGVLEIVETSNQALTGGITLGSRCYITRAREMIELIATGSLSPTFIPEVRVSGIGCIATHSLAAGDIYTFFLGPDEIYQWDGAQLRAVGGRTYNTITQLVDYNTLDQIQAVVYTPDSQYWIVVPPYIFIYDYRREIWDWDDVRDFQAIGLLTVQDLVTADLDHSEFVVIGDSAVQTIREDPSINTYLGDPIDSYFETKDFISVDSMDQQYAVAYDKYNTVWRIWFRGTPGEVIEVAISTDKGLTYPTMQTVTVNDEGVGIFFSNVPYGVLRIRFRSQAGSVYSIQGPLSLEWTPSGTMLPP